MDTLYDPHCTLNSDPNSAAEHKEDTTSKPELWRHSKEKKKKYL